MTFPKPERRKTTKARKDRQEAAVIAKVRADAVARDDYCRFSWECQSLGLTICVDDVGPCDGPSEWCHLKTRASTRNMPPEQRHGTAWTIQACQRHHNLLDGRQQPRIVVRCLTPDGTDGPISVEVA